MIIGSHVSFRKDTQMVGSIKEALSYGANALMLYTGAPQNTNRVPIDRQLKIEAYKLLEENNINIKNIIVHAPYIINLAGVDNSFAIRFLKEEIERCEALGISKLVLHPGSHTKLSREEGVQNIIRGLNEVINKDTDVFICLETMAGKGTEIGTSIDELKNIIEHVDLKEKLMVCLDTCHLNDSGYDMSNIDNYLDEFNKKIGINKIGCIHINDSKNELRAAKDRHENFGLGYIGFDNLINVIYNEKLKDIPKILETPYVTKTDEDKKREYPPYKFEIEMIKNKKFNSNIIKDIRNYYKED